MRPKLIFVSIATAIVLLPLIVYARSVYETLPQDIRRDKKAREVPESGEQDRYVRLMSAQSVRLVEVDGRTLRKAEGPARFLHNNTWLICDTALWDVDAQVIYASGNVSIEQDRTELKSDSLTYYIEENLATFRGSLVQLQDKDGNTLRTQNLDYNTKDSIAIFRDGGAMRDKDGQLIESEKGRYDSKIKEFNFNIDVNMFTDSVFIKTTRLIYESDKSLATFLYDVEAWKDDRTLYAHDGWYDRAKELFFFQNNVHLMSATQEGWCDTLFFDRANTNVKMLGHVQVVDDERGITSMAERVFYEDSVSLLRMYDDPVIIIETTDKDDNGTEYVDSVFVRADSLRYWTIQRWCLDSALVLTANKRLEDISTDPVANLRKQAAEEAAKRLKEAQENDPNAPPGLKKQAEDGKGGLEKGGLVKGETPDASEAPETPESPEAPEVPEVPETTETPDTLEAPEAVEQADTLASDAEIPAPRQDTVDVKKDSIQMRLDSLAAARADSIKFVTDSIARADSIYAHRDTSKVGFALARGNVKVFRRKMQALCDSLVYSDLDSLARLFKEPRIWNEGNHQYQADSIYAVVKDNKIDRAHLLSNAFIMIGESDRFYDQIKSAEMTAFFENEGGLRRFDALGGATALFYIKEKEKIATANKKEAKILSAEFADGSVQQITYYDQPKSDAYPVAQMNKTDMFLKGYDWHPELRPTCPADLTSRVPRASQRVDYAEHNRCAFKETERYFKGYMAKLYREIERSDSLRRVRAEQRRLAKAKADSLLTTADSLATAGDSLAATIDSLGVTKDSLSIGQDSLYAAQDSLANASDTLAQPGLDSLKAGTDSLQTDSDSLKAGLDSLAAGDTLSAKDSLRAVRKAEMEARRQAAEAKRAARIAAKEARWDELDARDALKQAAKDAKKTEKKNAKLSRIAKREEQQRAKEDALREKYKIKYLRKHFPDLLQ